MEYSEDPTETEMEGQKGIIILFLSAWMSKANTSRHPVSAWTLKHRVLYLI